MDRRMRLTRAKLDRGWRYRLMILVEDMTFRESGLLHDTVRQIDPTYKTKHGQYCGASLQVLCFKEEAPMREVQRLIGGRIVLPSDFSKSGEWNGRGSDV